MTDNGRSLVNVTNLFNNNTFLPRPAANTVVYTTTGTQITPPLTPTDTTGVARIVSPLRTTPDTANVCGTLMPGYVIVPQSTEKVYGSRLQGLPGYQIFGTTDKHAIYPYFVGYGTEYDLQFPYTVPATGSPYKIKIWLCGVEGTIGDVILKANSTTLTEFARSVDDDYVTRIVFNYTWTGTPGTNTTLNVNLTVDDTDFQIIGIEMPLIKTGAFKPIIIPGPTTTHSQSLNSFITPSYELTKFQSPTKTSETIQWQVDKNGGFPTPIFLKGNFYTTGTGVGVNYVSSYDTSYTEVIVLRLSSSSSNGLTNATLVYQGGTTVGGCFMYVIFTSS